MASEKTTVDLDNLASWDTVAPEYYNVRGAYTRDAVGYLGVKYENATARNNIVSSKVARDDEYFYFLAKTENPITGKETDNFMVLYLDTDRNHATGWEGYDYRIAKTEIDVFKDGAWTYS